MKNTPINTVTVIPAQAGIQFFNLRNQRNQRLNTFFLCSL